MRSVILAMTASLALAGCGTGWFSQKDPPLPGERVPVLELQRTLEAEDVALGAQGFIAPAPWQNSFWPQAGGYPNHAMQHLSLNEGALTRIWQTSIGSGGRDNLPLTVQPVVADGKVFALDTAARLSAFSIADGQRIWRKDVRADGDRSIHPGGGLAYANGALFATFGTHEVLRLNPETGDKVWRARVQGPARSGPTVLDGRVFVATLDNKLFALSTETGELLWNHEGFGESMGMIGMASPAASQDIVVVGFPSGELYGLRVENGALAWSENLASLRRLGAMGDISDIRGMPIIDKGFVFAISAGGRLMALEERTGERIWERDIGGVETPWVAGNHLFVLSNESELVGIGRDNGAIRWVLPLPRFSNPERRSGPIFWSGPVLAGGRLFIVGTNGMVMEVDPETGTEIHSWSAGNEMSIPPIVADETLYILMRNGTLAAYR